jgi:glycosyltransferase involved in cell wall biosynthesis
MKVLFIAPLPPPVNGHSLAAKVLFDDLVTKHSLEVINLSKDSLKEGVDSFKRIIEVVIILIEVFRKKEKVDIAYFTISESLAGNIKDLLIYIICFNILPKMYIHLHGGSIKRILFDRHPILFSINRFFFRRLGGVIVLGRSHLEIFEDFVDRNKIHVVPNFSQDYLFATEEEIGDKFKNTDPLRILFVGNLIEDKGYNEIVDAYLNLDNTSRMRVRIDFAGRFESDVHKMEFLRKISGIKEMRYHGIVDGPEKKALFSQAHIFCLPSSFFEGQPIGILEAYASGCVVLTTGQPGIRDIFIDGVNGFEIKERSASSLKPVFEKAIRKREQLFEIAISNRKIAGAKYRTSIYNKSLNTIIDKGMFRTL